MREDVWATAARSFAEVCARAADVGAVAHIEPAVLGVQVGSAAPRPSDDLRREAVTVRLLPDANDLALRAPLADLLRRGGEAPWGVEVFSTARKQLPPLSAAQEAAFACDRLCEVLAADGTA